MCKTTGCERKDATRGPHRADGREGTTRTDAPPGGSSHGKSGEGKLQEQSPSLLPRGQGGEGRQEPVRPLSLGIHLGGLRRAQVLKVQRGKGRKSGGARNLTLK